MLLLCEAAGKRRVTYFVLTALMVLSLEQTLFQG